MKQLTLSELNMFIEPTSGLFVSDPISKTQLDHIFGQKIIPLPKFITNKKKSRCPCKIDGCTTLSVSKKLCRKHGGGLIKYCKIPNCITKVQSHNLCRKHGAYGVCDFLHCTKFKINKYFCTKHSKS